MIAASFLLFLAGFVVIGVLQRLLAHSANAFGVLQLIPWL